MSASLIVSDPDSDEGELPSSKLNGIFLFTDLVGSMELKKTLGDTAGHKVLRLHDRIFRKCLIEAGGEENKETGDGFLAVFKTVDAAISFSLNFHAELDALKLPRRIRCRIGMNKGTAYTMRGTPAVEGHEKLVGVAVDLASRVTQVAVGCQTLMTREIFEEARSSPALSRLIGAVEWRAHGAYKFRGVDDRVEIFEVGRPGLAPLVFPRGNTDSRRDVLMEEEKTLGWRPGVGVPLRGRANIVMERRLGDGGFGEVWLGCDLNGGFKTVLKFCFAPVHLQALRREFTVLRLVKEVLGARRDIAAVRRIELDYDPYYLESEYAEGGDLADWAALQGGIDKLPPALRIAIVAEIADALAAAHSVGVIHKDIKPGNVLVRLDADGAYAGIMLSDFGISSLEDVAVLGRAGITAVGFTDKYGYSTSSSGGGTRLYLAPDLLGGSPATPRSDIYALGVMLYQIVIGDLNSPMGSGWEANVSDPMLRDDIASCVDIAPEKRLDSASELGRRLRHLEERRQSVAAAEKLDHAKRRLKVQRRAFIIGLPLLACILAAIAWVAYAQSQNRKHAEHEKYVAEIRLVGMSILQEQFAGAAAALKLVPENLRGWEWGYLNQSVNHELLQVPAHTGAGRAVRFTPDGSRIVTVGDDGMGHIWDSSSGRLVANLTGHTARIDYVETNPAGELILTASNDETARIWRMSDGALLHTLSGHTDHVNRARFSPDGKTVLTCSDDGTARLWDVATGKPGLILSGHANWVNDAVFSHLGDLIATASDDGTARLWETATGDQLSRWSPSTGEVNTIRFSPASDYLLTVCEDGTVETWDVETLRSISGKAVSPIAANGSESYRSQARWAEFSPDGKCIYVVMRMGRVECYSSPDLHPISLSDRLALEVECAAFPFVPTGPPVILGTKEFTLLPVRKSPMDDHELIGGQKYFGHTGDVSGIDFSPNGQLFASVSLDGTLRTWPLPRNLKARRDLSDITGATSLGFTPDEKKVVGISRAGRCAMVESFREPGQSGVLLGSPGAHYRSSSLSPGGGVVAICGEDEQAGIWPLQPGAAALCKFGQETVGATRIRFDPSGKSVAVAGQAGPALLFDAGDGHKLGIFSLEGRSPGEIIFSPDGKSLLAAYEERRAALFRVADGAIIRQWSFANDVPITGCFIGDRIFVGTRAGRISEFKSGSDAPVRTFDSRHRSKDLIMGASPSAPGIFVTAGDDGMLKIWSATDCSELLAIADMETRVQAITFSPNGRLLGIARHDKPAILLDSGPRNSTPAGLDGVSLMWWGSAPPN